MADPLSSDLEVLFTNELGGHTFAELLRDPQLTSWLGLFDKSSGSQVHWGQVVDAVPFVNAYRVSSGAKSFLWCCDSTVGGFQPFGVRPIHTIPIGSLVFYLVHPQTPWYGVIFASEPPPLVRNQHFRSDYIWQGSRAGIRVESAHQLTIKSQAGAGGIENRSCGRPIDQTSAGEWGAMAETGLAFFLDSFMAYMRADESTGLFLFLHDAMARLAGHNLQIRSSVGEREDLDDESEVFRRTGAVIHFWELLGLFHKSGTSTREYTAEEVQGTKAEYGVLEPAFDDQQPFYRVQKAEGYLGQGGRRSLCLPPSSGTVNRYASHTLLPGVYEESLSAAGALLISSAKRIILSKRPCIAIAKEIKRPEDPAGDSAETYNTSGGLNDQQAHIVVDKPTVAVKITVLVQNDLLTLAGTVAGAGTAGIATSAIILEANAIRSSYPDLARGLDRLVEMIDTYPSDPVPHMPEFGAVITRLANTHPTAGSGSEPPSNLVTAAAMLDLAAFDFNHTHVHPYAYRTSDYYFPEETTQPAGALTKVPSFSDLSGGQYLSAPTPAAAGVDHRYGKGYYYPNASFFGMLDDGGIVLRDGYGAEIKLSGGAIEITAPGDVWVRSGKNVNLWGGRDVIVRAQHSVDITAAKKDVRLKAENNVMVLGGNNGCGGVHLESRATCPGYDYDDKIGEDIVTTGITFKAENAHVMAWARDVILRAQPDTAAGMGQIVLESDNRVKVYSHYIERFIQDAAIDFFVEVDGTTLGANEYWADNATFTGNVRIAGILASGCHWVDGNIMVTGGHIATEQSDDYDNWVALLEGEALSDANALREAVTDRATELKNTTGPQEFDDDYRQELNDKIDTITFSLRNSGQYKTESLILFECYWQQLARLSGASLPTWSEPAVDVNGTNTYPHPGLGPWTGTDESSQPVLSYYKQDLDLYSFSGSDGNSAARGANQDKYETPVLKRPTPVALSGNYTIIVTP